MIADDRWSDFRDHYLRIRAARFHTLLRERLERALAESRLRDDALVTLFPPQPCHPHGRVTRHRKHDVVYVRSA